MTHMSLQIGSQRHQNECLAIFEEMPLHLGRPVKVLAALYPAANHDELPRALWTLLLVSLWGKSPSCCLGLAFRDQL